MRGLREPDALEPAVAVLAVTDLRLQRRECLGTRLDVGERPALALPGRTGIARLLLDRLNGRLQRVQRRLLAGEIGILLLELLLDLADRVAVGARQRGDLGRDALAAFAELREHAPDVVAPGLGDAHVLLDLGDALLHLGERPGRLGHRLVERGHAAVRRALLLRGALARGDRLLERLLEGAAVRVERRRLVAERGELRGELRHLLADAALRVPRERELLLEARHLGIGRVERALPLVQRVPGRVVVATQRLETGLRAPQLRLQRLEPGRDLGEVARRALAGADRVLLLREPRQVLRLLQARLHLAVLGGDLRLVLEPLELAAEFDADVLDAREVLARVRDPALGLLAPLAVLGDARGLLEEHPELLGLRLDDARDHPLLDDRVGARPEAGAEEQVVDVAAPDRDVVDVVRAVAVARQDALDRQLGILPPLSADAARAVVERELDRRAADRLAVAGAVEDDVLHRLAAQRGRLRLAQHPADGVDDVRLAATVGADDADELSGGADPWSDRRTT